MRLLSGGRQTLHGGTALLEITPARSWRLPWDITRDRDMEFHLDAVTQTFECGRVLLAVFPQKPTQVLFTVQQGRKTDGDYSRLPKDAAHNVVERQGICARNCGKAFNLG